MRLTLLLLVCSVQFILPPFCAFAGRAPFDFSSFPPVGYPDSTSGLERLAKDVVNAELQNNGPGEDALLQSLLLTNAVDWYAEVFDREAADGVGTYYQGETASIEKILADTFRKAAQGKTIKIRAVRLEQSCDDSDSQDAYGILIRRRQPIPLYELRFFSDGRLTRLFPLAYVNGAFRFFLFPDFRPHRPALEQKYLGTEKNPLSVSPVVVDANMRPPLLVRKVEPTYPEKTRRENASGAVKVHIIIDQQGQVSRILGAMASAPWLNRP